MNIWIDGDACPKQVKDILYRAATKRKVPLWIVANHVANIPNSSLIKRVVVDPGFDKADQYILEHIEEHDLVITSDTLLAEHVLAHKALALSTRGLLYTDSNIKQIVAMRNVNELLRSSGLIQGGQNKLHQKEMVMFANHLDRIITRFHRIH